MQTLFIKALKVTAITGKGKFGAFLRFDKGLNIIRASNTSGKSTIINSILYALGIEILLGKTGISAIKPVLKTALEYNNKNIPVLESFVELEILNNKDEIITIKRQIIGKDDIKLIKVNYNALLTKDNEDDTKDDYYYVGVEGAAQREKGFHQFLSTFLNIDRPYVPRYSGSDVPLYLECIMPLMFVEQVRGWSGIQATVPKMYAIQNVTKVSFEYLLKLDIAEIQRMRDEIRAAKKEIQLSWDNLHKHLNGVARNISGIIKNYPKYPSTNLEQKDFPNIYMLQDNNWIDIDNWIIDMRDETIKMKELFENKPKDNSELENELKSLEDDLLLKQAAVSEIRREYYNEKYNISELEERLLFINSDLKKNQDVKRLQEYGASYDIATFQSQCPTCHQEIIDVLLEQTAPPMSIDDNIVYLKQQKNAVEILLKNSKDKITSLKNEYDLKNNAMLQIRKYIRDLKNDLINSEKLPSIAKTRTIVENESLLERAEITRDQFEKEIDNLISLSDSWRDVLTREAELPKDAFSDLDKSKLNKLSELFRSNIVNFGFRSTNPELINISLDNYRPISEGFEMSFDVSASDNIRLLWAYTISLQKLSEHFQTNHFGISIFDEPGQQEIDDDSTSAFLKTISELSTETNQVIITTSKSSHNLSTLLPAEKCNIIELGDEFVIKPID